MNRRLISAAMAALVLMSFTSCGFIGRLRPENTTVSVTTEETAKETASETAATTEETTTEQTTSKEATAATEEPSSETTTVTVTSAPARSIDPAETVVEKSTVPSIPKGYKKVKIGWGLKYNGHVVYIVRSKKNDFEFKGWWKNKWIPLEYDVLGDQDGEAWYNDKYCDDYYQYMK